MRCNAKWLLLVLLAVGAADRAGEVVVAPQPAFAALPIAFEVNEGQTDASVKYVARGPGYGLFLTPDEAVLSAGGDAVRMKLVDANPAPRITGEERLPGKVNYFKGNDPEKWRTNVSTYRKVRYHEVYPGIDLIYYGKAGQLEYDFVVKPGANPDRIALELDEAFELDAGGDLVLATESGELRQRRPVVYQGEQRIDGEFVMLESRAVGFELGSYDSSQPLVIDPVLTYSTYLGGSGNDGCGDISIDSSGAVYLCGATTSLDFPEASTSPIQNDLGGDDYAAFVTKMNSSGTRVEWSTYLGGGIYDAASEIAVSHTGNVFVAGSTYSAEFPGAAASAIQSNLRGDSDAFVAKLTGDGATLVYATYLGGGIENNTILYRDREWVSGLAVDLEENVYLAGYTSSNDFPTVNAFQAVSPSLDTSSAYAAKIDAEGSSLVYSTYLGGSGEEWCRGMQLDESGCIFITGCTGSADFPVKNAYQAEHAGGPSYWPFDVFVTKLAADGASLEYSTFIGGSGFDQPADIAIDSRGAAYVVGYLGSLDFPTMGPFQSQHAGGPTSPPWNFTDGFVFKLGASGDTLEYSSYLGGSGVDLIYSISVDPSGVAHVVGTTDSSDFPTVDAIQNTHAGGPPIWGAGLDGFVATVDSTGSVLSFSSYLGGLASDLARVLTVNDAGVMWIGGQTGSLDFPVLHALQPTYGGGDSTLGGDAFLTRIGPEDTDGDGLPDEWELYGYTHENGTYVDLASMGADPLRKDLFVEIDYMAGFEPGTAALQAVVDAFAAAPVDNPDTTTGITLHILSIEEIAHVSPLGTLDGGNYVWTRPSGSGVTHFDDLKADHFPEELEWAVRYCIWADKIPGDFSGMSRGIEASDFIVSLGPFIEQAGGTVDPHWESGTFMHELGHNLGLKHGGSDDLGDKPNYLSVMNPAFQLEGLYFQGTRGHWDFSFETLADLDESALDETKGLEGTSAVDGYGTTWWMDGLPPVLAQQWTSAVNDPINWWDETALGQDPVFEVLSLDINDSEGGLIEVLAGFDDWGHITFTGGEVGGGVPLPPPPETPAEEQTLVEVRSFLLAEQVTGLKGHAPNKMYTLTWNPIKPKTEMTEYRVYRDGTKIAATTNTNYKDQAITPGDTHVYWITWVNLLGQESVPGVKVTIGG